MSSVRRPRGPTDHDRAARIARSTMQVVRQNGIAGLTHRAVAAHAGVPLGSTTYHFSSRQDLLSAALREAIAEFEVLIAEWSVGLDRTNVAARLAALMEQQSTPGAGRDQILVEYELYLAAARDENLRPLSRQWDAVLRNTLEERLGARIARIYFVAYVGFLMESLVSEEPLDSGELEKILNAIAVD